MAQTLQIRDSEHHVKMRSPWAVALLPIITLGIYQVVWWYKINRELRDYGRAQGRDLGQEPTLSLLALFPGGLIIVPALVSEWRGTKRVQGAARVAGREPLNGWIALVLYLLLAICWNAYLQSELNKIWHSEAVPLPGEPQLPAIDDGMPPKLPSEPEPTTPASEPGSSERPESSEQ